MLFVTEEKYNQMVQFYEKLLADDLDAMHKIYETVHQAETCYHDLLLLREVDKDCIKSLLRLLMQNHVNVTIFEKSLVEQALLQ